ncbi:MAG: SUMF1/EgtB/PvdO family nonheme iron enzyme [Myxococcales bacterium]|nr:SUMF1/EgtB/PvdO family nonheme iron enzyme [Myxococcales bacterium]
MVSKVRSWALVCALGAVCALGPACAHPEHDAGKGTAAAPAKEHDATIPPPVTVLDPRDARPKDAADAGEDVRDAAGDATDPSPEAPKGMKLVPGGTFTMGIDVGGQPDERPAHKVTLAPFFLDVTEITHAEYGECVKAGACRAPDAKVISRFGGVFVGPNKPVTGITWGDTRAYCAFRGKRLPREAELERAVRGDDGRRYPWGNEPPTHERTVFQSSKTEDVGTHPLGRGPYGHDDLAGNVWEWMEDMYDPFAYTRPGADRGEPGSCDEILAAQNKLRAEGKQGYTGSNPIPTECERSIRGGAYNYDADGLRSSNRVHHPGTFKLLMTGGRCAKDAR